jgi:hypothetical protein
MPNENEPKKPKPPPGPDAGTGAGSKPGSVKKPIPGVGPSKGVVSPLDNDEPPQNRKAAAAGLGSLIGALIDGRIGIPRADFRRAD